MITWIALSMMVGGLLAVAAVAGERFVRAFGIPARFVWGVAMLATALLMVVLPFRDSAPNATRNPTPSAVLMHASVSVNAIGGGGSIADAAHAGEGDGDGGPTPAADSRVTVSPTTNFTRFFPGILTWPAAAAASAARSIGVGRNSAVNVAMDVTITRACVAATLLALLALGATYFRFALMRRRWPHTLLLGTPVRVSPNTGPAAMGVAPAEVVVPAWLLRRPIDEQRLVLAHEAEHVRAHDTVLLLSACLLVALAPWNIALWFMWSRLRLAVEIDCDARVIGQVGDRTRYGHVLMELASRPNGVAFGVSFGTSFSTSFGVPAFSFGRSHLEARIFAMTKRVTRPSLLRSSAAGVFASALIVSACESRMPASGDVASATDSATASLDRNGHIQFNRNDHIHFISDGSVSHTVINPFKSSGSLSGPRFVEVYNVATLTDAIMPNIRPTRDDQFPLRGIVWYGALRLNGAKASKADVDTLLVSNVDSIVIHKGRNVDTSKHDPLAAYGMAEIWTKKSTF